MYPKNPTTRPQIKIPIESLGICTNICDQSPSLVKIATKIPENPINPPNPRIWYDKNPRLARISISEVTLMLKANPTKIPAKKIKKSVFLKFSFFFCSPKGFRLISIIVLYGEKENFLVDDFLGKGSDRIIRKFLPKGISKGFYACVHRAGLVV